jgi:hypothetical protein
MIDFFVGFFWFIWGFFIWFLQIAIPLAIVFLVIPDIFKGKL